MKLQKLNFDEFKNSSLSFSSMKSISGGAELTQVGPNSGPPEDYINNHGMTSFDCDDEKYDDTCGE